MKASADQTPLAWITYAVQAAVSLLGASALLYGIGLMVVRSYFDLLGIPAGLAWDVGHVAELGGRFLLHLVVYPVSIVASHASIALGVLAFLVLANAVSSRLGFVASPDSSGLLDRARLVIAKGSGSIEVVGLVVIFVLLETVWVSIEPHGMLYDASRWQELVSSEARAARYDQVVVRLVLAGILCLSMLAVARYQRAWVSRLVLWAQCVLVSVGILLWPVAYGKLKFQPSFPSIQYQSAGSDSGSSGLLLNRSAGDLLVWVPTLHRLEFVQKDSFQLLVVGERRAIELQRK